MVLQGYWSTHRALIVALCIALIWFALDQTLKSYAVSNVPRYPQRLEALPNVLELGYAENRGAAEFVL